jgi:hypothetical protein
MKRSRKFHNLLYLGAKKRAASESQKIVSIFVADTELLEETDSNG